MHHTKMRSWRRHAPLVGVVLASLFVFSLSAAGSSWMNDYYSAAAASGASNWQSFFYVGFDSGGFISVDKPPLGVWLSAVSVFIFGLSPLSIVLPHMIAGVLCAVTIFLLVRHVASLRLGLLATTFFLLTPITSVMFGYNQPDAVFTLLAVVSFYGFMHLMQPRAVANQWLWVVVTASALGLAFMAKTLQVLPLVVLYGVIFLIKYRHRPWPAGKLLLLGAGIFAATALWWPLAVWLTPASSRPYIGSTSDNSPWSLIVGYNGLGRITNPEQTVVQDTAIGAQFGGSPGLLRLFNSEFGPLIAWFLPLLLPAAIGSIHAGSPRHRHLRTAIGISTVVVLVYAALFSGMRGIIHPYYSVLLAPFVAISASAGLWWLIGWYHQKHQRLWWLLPVSIITVSFLSAWLLSGDTALRFGIAPLIACVGVAFSALLLLYRRRTWHQNTLWVVSLAIITLGPAAQTVASLQRSHQGPYPSVYETQLSTPKLSSVAMRALVGLQPHTPWLAVTESTYLAAPIQLETGQPVIALGGFNGTDPALSLSRLQAYVKNGKVRYYITSVARDYRVKPTAAMHWLMNHRQVYQDKQVIIYDLQTGLLKK